MRGLHVRVVAVLLVLISLSGVIVMRFGILIVGLSRSLFLRSMHLYLFFRLLSYLTVVWGSHVGWGWSAQPLRFRVRGVSRMRGLSAATRRRTFARCQG